MSKVNGEGKEELGGLSGKLTEKMRNKGKEMFICNGCKNEFKVKELTKELVDLKLCPKCFTEKNEAPPQAPEVVEQLCTICGNIATGPEGYCSHQRSDARRKDKEMSPELPGMPEKGEAYKVAEDILDLRDDIKSLRDKMKLLKTKFASEMRLIQKSTILVKGWEFEIEATDKITITKED